MHSLRSYKILFRDYLFPVLIKLSENMFTFFKKDSIQFAIKIKCSRKIEIFLDIRILVFLIVYERK